MPSSAEILAGLAEIAARGFWLAALWHIALTAVAVMLLGGWKPSRRLAAILCAAPLASASAMAWLFGNPFNGAVLGVAALGVVALGARLPRDPVETGPSWAVTVGVLVLAFGWVYPHFLTGFRPWVYVIAAPVGLVPCPTLAVVVGLALLGGGFGSRALAIGLGLLGLFYGLFGALRLGVWLDLGLLVGSAALVAGAALDWPRRRAPVGYKRAWRSSM